MNITVHYRDSTGADTMEFTAIHRVTIREGYLEVRYSGRKAHMIHCFAPHEWTKIEKEDDE